MSNPAIEWIKEHPAITASVAGGVGLIVYFMSRSGSTGSSSDVASVANAQVQQASLANQNAATQAAAQVQEQEYAYAAQASNNQNEAALASTVAQYNAQTNVAGLAAQVQENQTGAQESVSNNLINAELTAQQSQVAAESKGLSTEFAYLTSVNQNQTNLENTVAGDVTEFNGSQNRLALLQSVLGQPGAAAATEGSYQGVTQSQSAENAQIVNSITNGLSNVFTGLFG